MALPRTAAGTLAAAALLTGACSGGDSGNDDALPRLPADARYVTTPEAAPAFTGARTVRLDGESTVVGLQRKLTLKKVRTARGISPAPTPTDPFATEAPAPDGIESGALPPEAGGVVGDGRELLVAEVEIDAASGILAGGATVIEDRLALRVGDQTRDLPASDGSNDSLTVVAGVPKGAPVDLVLIEEGRPQSLDLRTGRRGDDAVDELYRPVLAGPREAVRWQVTVRIAFKGEAAPRVDGTRAGWDAREADTPAGEPDSGFRLVPYSPGAGWAPEGKMWLELGTVWAAEEKWFTFDTDEKRSFAVEAADGTTYRARHYEGSSTRVFLVPDGFRSGTLRITPQGEAKGSGDLDRFHAELTDYTVSPATPSSIPVRLERTGP
ncbi:hypothetical protein ACXZ65_37880 [Streptomyces aculeolatus]